VYGLCSQFLAAAAFPTDEDGRIGRRYLSDLLPQAVHGLTLADHAQILVSRRLRSTKRQQVGTALGTGQHLVQGLAGQWVDLMIVQVVNHQFAPGSQFERLCWQRAYPLKIDRCVWALQTLPH
jgi:hypothetical protein